MVDPKIEEWWDRTALRLRIVWAVLTRPFPPPDPPPPKTATEKVLEQIAEAEAKIAAVPEERRLCCNDGWYKPYIRLIYLRKLLETVRREGL